MSAKIHFALTALSAIVSPPLRRDQDSMIHEEWSDKERILGFVLEQMPVSTILSFLGRKTCYISEAPSGTYSGEGQEGKASLPFSSGRNHQAQGLPDVKIGEG